MSGKKPLFSANAAEEYFSMLLTYYRNTGNDIFKRDNEGRHVSDQIYSAEYQKYLGMQIAMREVLEYFAKFELVDTALRQCEHFREVTKKVEPLNLDELRKMDGEPVWVSVSNNWRESGVSEGWCIVRFHSEDDRVRVYIYDTRHGARFFAQQDYGESWWAYRQKPEEDKHETD